jgi:hypothetical protein
MTAAPQPGPEDELGPVDFLAIEFPGGQLTAAGFERLLSLADQGVVDILDMEFITKDADGTSKKIDVWEFAVPGGVDLSAWAGASSGLLDDSDVAEISAAMQPGSVAVVVIYENRWALGLVDAWRRDGARLIASGGLPADEILAALDVAESS